jgi:hypothetical protein
LGSTVGSDRRGERGRWLPVACGAEEPAGAGEGDVPRGCRAGEAVGAGGDWGPTRGAIGGLGGAVGGTGGCGGVAAGAAGAGWPWVTFLAAPPLGGGAAGVAGLAGGCAAGDAGDRGGVAALRDACAGAGGTGCTSVAGAVRCGGVGLVGGFAGSSAGTGKSWPHLGQTTCVPAGSAGDFICPWQRGHTIFRGGEGGGMDRAQGKASSAQADTPRHMHSTPLRGQLNRVSTLDREDGLAASRSCKDLRLDVRGLRRPAYAIRSCTTRPP